MAKNVIAETESDILRYLAKQPYIDHLRDVEATLRRDFERTITGVKASQAYVDEFESLLEDYIKKVTKAHNYFVSNEGEREEQRSGRWAYGFPEGPNESEQFDTFTRLRDAAYDAKTDLYDYQNQAGERTQTVGLANDARTDKRNDKIKDGAKRVGGLALILGGAAVATAAAVGIGNAMAGSGNSSRTDDHETKAKAVHHVKEAVDYTGGGQWQIGGEQRKVIGEKTTIEKGTTFVHVDETTVQDLNTPAPAPAPQVYAPAPAPAPAPQVYAPAPAPAPAAPAPAPVVVSQTVPPPVTYVNPGVVVERVTPVLPPVIIHGRGAGHPLPPPPPPHMGGHHGHGGHAPRMGGGYRGGNTTIINNTINSNNQNCGNRVQVQQTHNMRQTIQTHVSNIKVQRTHVQPTVKVQRTQPQPTMHIKRTTSSPAPMHIQRTRSTPQSWNLPSGRTGRTISAPRTPSRSAPRAPSGGRCGGGSPMRRGGR